MTKFIEWFFIGIAFICLPFALLFGFIAGLVCKVLGIKEQNFTRYYDGLGELTSKATSEKKCKMWSGRIAIGPWHDAQLLVKGKVLDNPEHRSIVTKELIMTQNNIDSILDAVKHAPSYLDAIGQGLDPLVPQDTVNVELCLGESGYIDPYVAISFNTSHNFVWFSVQNAEMTFLDINDTTV